MLNECKEDKVDKHYADPLQEQILNYSIKGMNKKVINKRHNFLLICQIFVYE